MDTQEAVQYGGSIVEQKQVQGVLDEFSSVFSERKGLPPPRAIDHAIPSRTGTNVKPYRYPYLQANETEKKVSEMLHAEIIRPNNSPYSTPMISVKKKDRSWRLCTDYRALNKVTTLQPFLRKFVLVFFDDVLIYSSSWEDHLQHLRTVLGTLVQHEFTANLKKCSFGQQEIEYLGHIISAKGVAMDTRKIKVELQWSLPKSVKSLRGFLGLAGRVLQKIH